MNIAYYKEYSRQLGRNMEFKRYGWGGKICVVFPCLNGRFYDYEDFRMPEAIAPFLDSRKLQLFCVDGMMQKPGLPRAIRASGWNGMKRGTAILPKN